ncbi:META domain-containing protein [Kangiella marina]|uniref:DUF306 domain-containing protein n=1 Tax=Kangiella marina TaxID=1079178 RepID=A0ABP8IKK4_9GAMM
MKYTLTLFITALTLGLTACKKETIPSDSHQPVASNFQVTAELMYREKMLAPEGSTVIATIQDVSIADKAAKVLSEEIIGLGGGVQLPLEVTLDLPKKQLQERRIYSLHAKVEGPDGQLMWISTTRHTIDISGQSHDMGKILLERVQSGTVGSDVDSKYPIPFTAKGNEPGWLVKIEQNRIEIQTNYGQNTVKAPRPIPQPYKGGYKYHAETDAHIAIIDVRRKLCYDDMSGRPYPARVTLTLDGKTYEGCGGDPLTLLTDVEWVVEDIAKTGIIDRSRVTINFDTEGRAYGISSCNSYSAAYTLTGENLTFNNPVGTMKACPPALMNQEKKFLDTLNKVTRYDIDGYGALILTTETGKTITARQQ